MRLLIRSVFRHLKKHLLQTVLTMAVTVLVTGMLTVLLHFAFSFQRSLRTYALEKYGTYCYEYYTRPGTGAAGLFEEMYRRFREDSWFSEAELVEDGSQGYLVLRLTVAHPGFFTTKTMERKFQAVKEACYEQKEGEGFFCGENHNYELLASCGDLSRRNGIYSYLLTFLALLAAVAGAAVLTLGAVFQVSAMQREREIALLAGIGADRRQIAGMMLMESISYCLVSIPAGFLLGILAYRGIQGHIDNVIYDLFRFPPADLVISAPCCAALAVCAASIILLSGLRSVVRMSRISPMEALSRTREIRLRGAEAAERPAETERKKSGRAAGRAKLLFRAGQKNPYELGRAGAESWLAEKSWRRFRRRNRPLLLMMALTFALCFVLTGYGEYSMEVVRMSFDAISYNFAADLYSDDREELDRLALMLDAMLEPASDSVPAPARAEIPYNRLAAVKEAVFYLHQPYPLSELGEASLNTNVGRVPDVVIQCIEEESFGRLCEELGISGEAAVEEWGEASGEPGAFGATGGLWGIFVNAERSWWYDGVKVKGNPYALEAGEQLKIYTRPESREGEEEIVLTIAGVCGKSPLYAEITESTELQILAPEAVFAVLEEKCLYSGQKLGAYHVSLRGNVEDGGALGEFIEKQAGNVPGITCRITDLVKQQRREKAAIDSFAFLCGALICILVFICSCGNFTLFWAVGRAREREFAILLSLGMTPGSLQRMRLYEQLHNMWCAFLPGVLAGMCVYQWIYLSYTSEYRLAWRFPLPGFLLGMAALAFSVGAADLAQRPGNGRKSLSERLRMEE